MAACGWEPLGCESCSAYADLDPLVRAEVDAWAVDRLWEWTHQRFGPCEELVRPCRKTCTDASSYGGGTGLLCGKCGDSCSCRDVQQIVLPGPINDLIEILIDGEEVDLSAFRVDDWHVLVRQDGGSFPPCQDLGKPAGEEGTWQIRYLLGED